MERTWLIGGGAVLAVLLAASVIVALARGESEFEQGSPELAVQQYLKALAENDFETAESLWSPELREDCSFEEFLLNTKRGLDLLSGARVTLDDVQDRWRNYHRVYQGSQDHRRRHLRPI